ncbi:MAG: protein-L-isoaspartate(D-aspartate) O-methyltransferase [Deltaproteobacteria bacterium]|nr:protein-L-isoaspartate(D-aspartate) O-methyltransferase [Deltaproteobacteria bacterium]
MSYHVARRKMVEEQLIARGIRDSRVIEAMEIVPRHEFVQEALAPQAHNDHPLNIGEHQTISQPYIVATMTEALALKGGEKVLELGTGSGYQTAILAMLADKVFSIERITSLSNKARQRLHRMGYQNVTLRTGDGSVGWPEEAPFDAILVTAASPGIPEALPEQLKEGGRLVIPIGSEEQQELFLVTKTAEGTQKKSLGGCRFVKLVGQYGFPEEKTGS